LKTKDLSILIAQAADAQKATDVVILDVHRLCNFTDSFVIATCDSGPQLRAAAGKIEEALRDADEKPFASAGYETGSWVVLDCGDVVVHLLSQETRDYYQLEALWNDAKRVAWTPKP
jgi:ribosome-associated protein